MVTVEAGGGVGIKMAYLLHEIISIDMHIYYESGIIYPKKAPNYYNIYGFKYFV